eukprot:TRINITY_DN24361_c0_g1_i3.p1 TRINITY_DN24361_c0_g1~~TRINITY_DN24361_c0_g1_i3.p1  ORF type:complete len:161 (-),score=48.54 TRINITY_DN24361_c0_g1_i3:129-611(-)
MGNINWQKKMEAKATQRLTKELEDLNRTPSNEAVIVGENLSNWIIYLPGPKGSFYEGGVFQLSFAFPNNYPFKAPKVKFETKIYHPNVKSDTGEICQDIYEKDWSPVKTVRVIIDLLVSMLRAPNIDSPIEPEIARQYNEDRPKFEQTVKDWISRHAKAT